MEWTMRHGSLYIISFRKLPSKGTSHAYRESTYRVRTYFYVVDASIFVKPIKNNITFLNATTLANFRDVIGLVTNCEKNQVAPI
jgi:hypothetical protein